MLPHATAITNAYTGETPIAKVTKPAAATPPKPPAASPNWPKNGIPIKSPPTYL